MKRLAFGIILLVGFLLTLATLSQTFDGDFGWHLRFGQETMAGAFPYLDTYTWSFAGQPWVNHEWGSEVIFWLTYTYFTYIGLLLLIAILVYGTFIFFPRWILGSWSLSGLLASIVALSSINYLLAVRQTVIAPLFFALLVVSLEKIHEKKYYYAWPVLFWVWAAMHGSWIVGFATIGVYVFVQIVTRLVRLQWFKPEQLWDTVTNRRVAGAIMLAVLATLLNPYGFGLWKEVSTYFSTTYYHQYISEWLPSYAYPVYWSFVALVGVTLVLLVKGIREHQVRLSHCLLFLAFLYAGISHRRHAIYFALLSTPLLAVAFDAVGQALKQRFPCSKTVGQVVLAVCALGLFFCCGPKLLLQTDPWKNTRFLAERGYPIGAVHVLRDRPEIARARIFNEFRWGGFLNWQLPTTLVYLDGRGTATWPYTPTQTLYEHYRELRFGEDALKKIDADYILIQKQFTGYPAPNRLNRWTFGSALEALKPTNTPLELSLQDSPVWQKLYEDSYSILYYRHVQSPGL